VHKNTHGQLPHFGRSGRFVIQSDEYPHSDYPVRQRPGRRPGDQASRYNESLFYVYDAGMAADRDQLAVCAVPGRKAEVTASASSACSCEAVAVTRGCSHAPVGVLLTGSRTVLSPKSATRSSRPPRAFQSQSFWRKSPSAGLSPGRRAERVSSVALRLFWRVRGEVQQSRTIAPVRVGLPGA
jgi:hypothetical protein